MPKLENQQHEKVAEAIARGAGRYEAYMLGGYEGTRQAAYSLYKKNPEVLERSDEIHAELGPDNRRRFWDNIDWIMDAGRHVYDRAIQEDPKFDGKGNQVGTAPHNLGVALKAVEMLGRNHGLFATNATVTHKKELTVEGKSHAELIEMFGPAIAKIAPKPQLKVIDATIIEPDAS